MASDSHTNWEDMDTKEIEEHYQDAQLERDKEDDERNWTDDDIKDMEKEISERDGV